MKDFLCPMSALFGRDGILPANRLQVPFRPALELQVDFFMREFPVRLKANKNVAKVIPN
jgi:hypothetical protein